MDKKALANTKRKLAAGGRFKVGYLGGSITEGAGASDPSVTSWRALTTKWFGQQYASSEVREIYAAIGGTGSDFGAFRCREDLLSFDPDLVFVEFAVNDGTGPVEDITASMEGIVRQIRAHDPRTDIIFIYTINKELAGLSYACGALCNGIVAGRRLAAYYGIPEINVGLKEWELIASGGETWETMTIDGTHPTDRCYGVYALEVEQSIAHWLEATEAEEYVRDELPALSTYPLEHARTLDVSKATGEGWGVGFVELGGKRVKVYGSEKPGALLHFRFTGRMAGFSMIMDRDSGIAGISLDGGEMQTRNCFDHYCLSFRRINYCLYTFPEGGAHEITLRVLPDHDALSTGRWIRICRLLAG